MRSLKCLGNAVAVSTGKCASDRRPPPLERRRHVLSTMTANDTTTADVIGAANTNYDARDVLAGRLDDATVRHAVEVLE